MYETKTLETQLQWLVDVLIDAEKNNEKVHILGHVPINTDSCLLAWKKTYIDIVRRFAHIISGQFNGHSHNDEFHMFYSNTTPPEAINIAWNGGSGTSFERLNSNYRLYDVDTYSYVI